MKLSSRLLLAVFLTFIIGIFIWALRASPEKDITERIYQAIKDQEKKADLTFTDVTFEEVIEGVKYWQLNAQSAMVNKSAGVSSLVEAKGAFYKNGKAVLRFISPAALWDMHKKEILLDQPVGYDVALERKISSLLKTIQDPQLSVFNLPSANETGTGYWFKSKNLIWRFENQKLLCSGGILLSKGNISGYARELEGDVALEKLRISGDPKIIIKQDDGSQIEVSADEFAVISSENRILASGGPVIKWKEAVVKTERIEYLEIEKVLVMEGSVKIEYADISAWGESARYHTKTNEVVLEGGARAMQAENRLSGEKVLVSLNSQKISVMGRGKAVFGESKNEH